MFTTPESTPAVAFFMRKSTKIMNKHGAKTSPCRTPVDTSKGSDMFPSTSLHFSIVDVQCTYSIDHILWYSIMSQHSKHDLSKLNHVQFSVKIGECEVENVVRYKHKCLGVLDDNKLD